MGRSGWRGLARGRVVALLPCTQMHSVAVCKAGLQLKCLLESYTTLAHAVFCSIKTRPVETVQPQEQPVVFVFQPVIGRPYKNKRYIDSWIGMHCLPLQSCPQRSR